MTVEDDALLCECIHVGRVRLHAGVCPNREAYISMSKIINHNGQNQFGLVSAGGVDQRGRKYQRQYESPLPHLRVESPENTKSMLE